MIFPFVFPHSVLDWPYYVTEVPQVGRMGIERADTTTGLAISDPFRKNVISVGGRTVEV